MKAVKLLLIITLSLLKWNVLMAQNLEYYAGHKRTGVDVMWFKNFKDAKDKKTPFLFFSRNRASTDYHGAPTSFGSTNAVSYNLKNGLGVVGVASFLNAGFTPKAGIQYFRQKGSFMFFGWLVTDLKKNGSADLFGLFRYVPAINSQWKIFSQLELFPVYNPSLKFWNLTQRVRLGTKYHLWAAGLMLDLNQQGKIKFTTYENIGGFLRYDF